MRKSSGGKTVTLTSSPIATPTDICTRKPAEKPSASWPPTMRTNSAPTGTYSAPAPSRRMPARSTPTPTATATVTRLGSPTSRTPAARRMPRAMPATVCSPARTEPSTVGYIAEIAPSGA